MSDEAQGATYTVAHIDDMPFEEGSSPGTEWKPVRRIFSIGSFGTALARATNAGRHADPRSRRGRRRVTRSSS